MKDYLSVGSMPHKLDTPLNLQNAFSGLTQQILTMMFNILEKIPQKDYPYSNYELSPDSDGNREVGIQLTIEADIFGTDQMILRRHFQGYTVVINSIDDNIGSMEYEFMSDDTLVSFIPKDVQDYMDEKLY